MHDDGEELLLEREPVEARLDPLGSVAPAAHLLGLLVAFVIVVELGVLQLVLVAFLHTGNRDAEVEVVHVDVPRDHAFHSHEGQHVVHHIAVLGEAVALLDVASPAEGQPHHDAAVAELGDLEVEVPRMYVLAGIDAERIVGLPGPEEVEVGTVVVVIVLDLHRIRLGALGVELYPYLRVLYGDYASLLHCRGIEKRVLIYLGGTSGCSSFRRSDGALLRKVERHLFHGHVSPRYRILLCQIFSLLAGPARLVDAETYENRRYESKSYNRILVHLPYCSSPASSSLRICISSSLSSPFACSMRARICSMRGELFFDAAKNPMLFS